jgi:transcriptional regulator with XRE-family HTH domain
MLIGKNLIRYRNELEMSQEELGRLVNKHQSTISRVESDLQGVPYEEIPIYAAAVGKSPDDLVQQDNISLHIQTQNGGNANNYVVNNSSEATLAAKNEVIAAKSELIAVQQAHIAALEKEIAELKDKHPTHHIVA